MPAGYALSSGMPCESVGKPHLSDARELRFALQMLRVCVVSKMAGKPGRPEQNRRCDPIIRREAFRPHGLRQNTFTIHDVFRPWSPTR